MLTVAMGSAEVENESLGWNDDESWEFPVLPIEDNGGKILIDGGKILTDATVSEKVNEVPPAKGKKRTGGGKRGDEGKGGGGGSGESDDHELHIWTERERRKKMRTMFATLHALIPHVHPRADKSSIVDEAVVYIKRLQQILEDLQNQKLEKEKEKGKGNANATGCDAPAQSRESFMAEQGSTSAAAGPNPMVPVGRAAFKTWSSPNVVLNVCGMEAHINIVCSPTKPGILTTLVLVMDKFNLELVSGHVSSDPTTRIFMFHVRANGIPQQFPEASFLVEETYKQAAAELTIWINS